MGISQGRFPLLAATIIVAFPMSGIALAQEVPSRAYPHWCEDLIGEHAAELGTDDLGTCGSDPRSVGEASTVEEDMASLDPREFLPEELAEFVVSCQSARERDQASRREGGSGDSWFAWCVANPPLRGLVERVSFIPRGARRASRIAAAGARVVPVCDGVRELQIDGARSPRAERRLLRSAFDVDGIRAAAASSHALDLASGGRMVDACSVPRRGVDARVTYYEYTIEHRRSASGHTYVATTDAGDLPAAYASAADCAPLPSPPSATGVRSETATTPPELMGRPSVDHITTREEFLSAMEWTRRLLVSCSDAAALMRTSCADQWRQTNALFEAALRDRPCDMVQWSHSYAESLPTSDADLPIWLLAQVTTVRGGVTEVTAMLEMRAGAAVDTCGAAPCECVRSGLFAMLQAMGSHVVDGAGGRSRVSDLFRSPGLSGHESDWLRIRGEVQRMLREPAGGACRNTRFPIVERLFERAAANCRSGVGGGGSMPEPPRCPSC